MTERDKYDFITRLTVMGAGVMEDPDIDYVARESDEDETSR